MTSSAKEQERLGESANSPGVGDELPPYAAMDDTSRAAQLAADAPIPVDSEPPSASSSSRKTPVVHHDYEGLIPVERNNDSEGLIPVHSEVGDEVSPLSSTASPVFQKQQQQQYQQQQQQYGGGRNGPSAGPSPNSPFNFPPPYAKPGDRNKNNNLRPQFQHRQSSSSRGPTLIAVPQLGNNPTSPFLSAYNQPILLQYGIPKDTFTNFLITLSAFLSASVSDRALSHVQDVGRRLGDVPKNVGRETLSHAKSVGRSIKDSAKSGNYIGAAAQGLFRGAVGIPVSAAFRVVGATVSLPGTLAIAASKKPLTPRERADAYVQVAERDWFAARGLSARLLTTPELLDLAQIVRLGAGDGVDGKKTFDSGDYTVDAVIEACRETAAKGPDAQARALAERLGIAGLEIAGPTPRLDIGARTLWFVLTDAESGSMDEFAK
ncbi:hypothetical protein F5Y16DRAFT_365550 [Xylariaceae sp. FL0255]|nr:hypothetical protein F5Y16DRAFT_365550 [Xylariaceae sp. FL0255]